MILMLIAMLEPFVTWKKPAEDPTRCRRTGIAHVPSFWETDWLCAETPKLRFPLKFCSPHDDFTLRPGDRNGQERTWGSYTSVFPQLELEANLHGAAAFWPEILGLRVAHCETRG